MNKKRVLGWVIFFALIALANVVNYLYHWPGFWIF